MGGSTSNTKIYRILKKYINCNKFIALSVLELSEGMDFSTHKKCMAT